MKKIELLAPAGSQESLIAAVQCGADAVYLGGNKFSARAYASNFDNETLKKAIDYCHLYNVKLYVTVNTLQKDNEILEALEYIGFLHNSGVDAVLLQDLGLAYLVRKNYPNLEIHASTQLTAHNAEGVKFLNDYGFKRIVLSRELSLPEIKYISKDLNIETEIFVHGALCVCYSGQCLMSSMIGGRSGNRGRCAQSCRLPYSIINTNSQEEKRGFILSPKDMNFIENIKEIIDSGTSSLKIEGRMKKPEYVAGVVTTYRNAIDTVYNGKKFDTKTEMKKLTQLFNREGFSKGYLFGNVGKDMMAFNFPKNTGIFIGKAINKTDIMLTEALNIGDGVRVNEDGFVVSSILKDGRDISSAVIGDKITLKQGNFKKGEPIYKTNDIYLMKTLKEQYMDPFRNKHKLEGTIKFKLNEAIEFSTKFRNKLYTVYGEIVKEAIKKPLDKGKIIDNLSKTGNTAFEFSEINFSCYEEGFLPISSLNSIRRELLKIIEEDMVKIRSNNIKLNLDLNREPKKNITMPRLLAVVNTNDQLEGAIEANVSSIAIDLFNRRSNLSKDHVIKNKTFIKIPNIIKEEFDYICKTIDELLPNIQGIITSNLGIISRYHDKTDIIGDYKLNVFNKYALDFFSSYIIGSCVSVELNKNELNELIKNAPIGCQILGYGKVEMMVSEYCPIGSTFGGKSCNNSCSMPCENSKFLLKDRKNADFIIKTDKFCRSHIYNSVAINLCEVISDINNSKIDSIRLDFIDENFEEVKDIITAFSNNNSSYFEQKGNYTKGHYKRGVE
ncbi:U32 family peptidase [Clostridium cellulovorans]|uniref:Peptidase U32 n=1 Tax=Clostridium cellulovorans (strain ATCC 35296 / DSM 3052 / OCM 3 / 743B) TaxID=573061 RepID=D9SN03_CLOC7|nr:U32 family peptidase [Clostridium cellulovorans]ADL51869.1 peptidase U32 [Clostridium cellulovorans 743B]